MDANSRKILGLISEMNVRFVVPVYQRPYSWGEAQCAQLWDDILSCGRSRSTTHFTGSIVTIQDGHLSDQGVAPLQIIDGQQRITTISLLLIALARFAREHPERVRSFSADEIIMGGYLTNHYRTGADRYKLTLSKDDHTAYQALIDALETGSDWDAQDAPARLRDNLAFFERSVEALSDVDSLWAGLQRLEVVGIALAQGQDVPQVIFESMNSTGKDLAVADLVRNFVLMSYPMAEQSDLYRTYWQPIERILGAAGDFDDTFDDFLRCYLSIVHAPTSMAGVDIYQAFKRYVRFMGFDTHDRMKNLCLRVKRFATYYVAVTRQETADTDVRDALARIARLKVSATRPLLMTLLDAYDHHELTQPALLGLLAMLESYLTRRSVCNLAPSEMVPFLSSLVARIEAVRNEEADVESALVAMLANEEGTPQRFPNDAEFAHALRTRDAANFPDAGFVLAALEQELSGSPCAITSIIHIMPTRALDDETWHDVLGPDAESAFESHVNALGNLTLADVAFDAPTASFAERQAQAASDGLALTADVRAADLWSPSAIDERTKRLADVALTIWKRPVLDEGAGVAFRLTDKARERREVTFADLFDAKLVEMDDALVSVSPMHQGRANVTSTGKIMLPNGEMFEDPTPAWNRFLQTLGWEESGQSGWMMWRRGDGGPILDDLRGRLLEGR